MVRREKKGRKLVAVPEPIVEELMVIARSTGLTLPELVSLILSYAVKALKGRDSVRELFSDIVLLSDMNRLGAVPVPQRSLARLMEELSEAERARLVEDIRGIASTAAITARLRGVYADSPRDIIRLILPDANVDEYRANGGGYIVITLREHYGDGFIELVRGVATAVLEGLGYRVSGVEVHGAGSVIVVHYRRPASKEGAGEG